MNLLTEGTAVCQMQYNYSFPQIKEVQCWAISGRM